MPNDGCKTWTLEHLNMDTIQLLLGYKKRGFGKGLYVKQSFWCENDRSSLILLGGMVLAGKWKQTNLLWRLLNGSCTSVILVASFRRTLLTMSHYPKEEAGIVARLEPCGILLFVLEGVEFAYHVHIYRSHAFEGDPTEYGIQTHWLQRVNSPLIYYRTEEMRPEWFSIPSEYQTNDARVDLSLPPIPYESMWDDDRLWIPFLLSKKSFVGRIDFNADEEVQHVSSSRKYLMQKWWIGTPDNSL